MAALKEEMVKCVKNCLVSALQNIRDMNDVEKLRRGFVMSNRLPDLGRGSSSRIQVDKFSERRAPVCVRKYDTSGHGKEGVERSQARRYCD